MTTSPQHERLIAQIPHEPRVTLRRIHQIPTYEIMEADLQSLEQATAREQQALAFFTLCLGMLVPTIVTWATSGPLDAIKVAVYLAAVGVEALMSLWFGATWWRESRARPKILARIRAGSLEVHTEYAGKAGERA